MAHYLQQFGGRQNEDKVEIVDVGQPRHHKQSSFESVHVFWIK